MYYERKNNTPVSVRLNAVLHAAHYNRANTSNTCTTSVMQIQIPPAYLQLHVDAVLVVLHHRLRKVVHQRLVALQVRVHHLRQLARILVKLKPVKRVPERFRCRVVRHVDERVAAVRAVN